MNSSNTTDDKLKHPPLHSALLFLGLAALALFLVCIVHPLWSDVGRLVFGWVLLIPNMLLVLTRVFAAIRKRSRQALSRRVSTIDAIGQVTFLAMGFANWMVFLSVFITMLHHHFGATSGDALIFSIGLVSWFAGERHPLLSALGFFLYVVIALSVLAHWPHVQVNLKAGLTAAGGWALAMWIGSTGLLGLTVMWDWVLAPIHSIVFEKDTSLWGEKHSHYLQTFYESVRNIVWQATTTFLACLAVEFTVFHPLNFKMDGATYLAWACGGLVLVAALYVMQVQAARREAWLAIGRVNQARLITLNPVRFLGGRFFEIVAHNMEATVWKLIDARLNCRHKTPDSPENSAANRGPTT